MVVKEKRDGYVEMLDGVVRQSLVYGEKTHLVKFFLKGGKEVPMHSHPEEQTGYLIHGKLIFIIENTRYELSDGASWSIPGNVVHGTEMIEDCEVVETFSPVRKDYLTE